MLGPEQTSERSAMTREFVKGGFKRQRTKVGCILSGHCRLTTVICSVMRSEKEMVL